MRSQHDHFEHCERLKASEQTTAKLREQNDRLEAYLTREHEKDHHEGRPCSCHLRAHRGRS